MISVGISEIQNNSSIFLNLTDVVEIVDKKKKEVLAFVYPVRKSKVLKLAGKYKNRVKKTNLSFDEIKEKGMMEAMKEKYFYYGK